MFENLEKYLDNSNEDGKEQECVHEFYSTVDGLTCIRCQFQKSDDSDTFTSNHRRQISSPGIQQKELEFLNLGDKLSEIANNYFIQVCENKVYRGDKRKGIICACVYHAYLKIGEFESIDRIVQQFNLTYQKAADGLKLIKIKIPETRNVVESPVDIAKGIMRQLNLKTCSKFELFLQSDLFVTSLKISKRLKLIIAGLIFKFIQKEYKSSVKLTDFCNKLDISITDLEKLLQHELCEHRYMF